MVVIVIMLVFLVVIGDGGHNCGSRSFLLSSCYMMVVAFVVLLV
jgi:hypothetical protein